MGRHGAPEKFLCDNSVAFNPTRRGYTGKLVEYLRALGVETITVKRYEPTTQGTNERVHQTFHRYLTPQARTMKNLQALVDVFDHIDNTERDQQGLDGHSTPGEAWARTAPVPSPVAPPTEPPVAPPTALEILAELTVLGTDYRLGKSYTGDEIDVRRHHTTIAFHDHSGALILQHPTPPKGTRHVGSGKPSGGPDPKP